MATPQNLARGLLGLPADDTMAQMGWQDLINLRAQLTDRGQQNQVAPYEHRAYARENVTNPLNALQMAVQIPGYQAFKAINGNSRSDPSWSQVGQGLLGTWEGLTK